MATATPTLDAVADALLLTLTPLLPAAGGGLPAPTVTIVTHRERLAGLGRHLGQEDLAGFGVIARKAVRLEAIVRFQLWAASPADVDAAIGALNARVLAQLEALRVKGLLRLTMKDARPSQQITNVGWRRAADYRVLYEFAFVDTDEAESLLAGFPSTSTATSTNRPSSPTRWRAGIRSRRRCCWCAGRRGVGSIAALSFLPTAPTGTVVLRRTFDGAQGPPAPQPTLAAFLAAVQGAAPAERHAAVTFASVAAFLAAFDAGAGVVALGDWDQDGVLDQYAPRTLAIDPPIDLPGVADRLELAFEHPALDVVAVMYLRMART